jgi:nicotinate-nucleotide pyrophosphorylase (carboxylating)
MKPPLGEIREQAERVLREDVGTGDLTAMLIREDSRAEARIVVREAAVLCGIDWANAVFRLLDPDVRLQWHAGDGDRVEAETEVCLIRGSARSLLTAERVALNFLQTLSATATCAARYVEAVAGTGACILDTRKTIPGLRHAQKYAVTCGGASNHRIGLFDAILIKENHIAAAGSVAEALAAAHRMADVEIEIEVENLGQLEEALHAGARRVLLDNFEVAKLREAVRLNAGRARLEASGGVDLESVRAIAETGVDDISVGLLTKDIRAIDLSMRFTG